ncbi:acid-sensing ion channel 1A-like [Centruroides vittatus]|uniref:acid-sensing ion channel 1A-like n=1 Tax=Centruroides vittatus TaxID=120091 RepID=UPI003510CF2C
MLPQVNKLKVLWVLCCLGGFLYQAWSFLELYLAFETVVDVEIFHPESIEMPAFTFCSWNGIRKSKYCEKFPDRCNGNDTIINVCSTYPSMCKYGASQNLHLPKRIAEYEKMEHEASREIMKEFGHQKSIISDCDYSWKSKTSCKKLRYQYGVSFEGPRNCYTSNSRIWQNLTEPEMIPVLQGRNVKNRYSKMNYFISFDPEEYMVPERQIATQFDIHPADELVDPFRTGISLFPGYNYQILMSVSEIHLLPYPYNTNCFNYTKDYLEKKGTTPWSRSICMEKCYVDVYIKKCKCVPTDMKYVHDTQYCNFSSYGCIEEFDVTECLKACKKDCRIIKYDYEVKKMPLLPVVKYFVTDPALKGLHKFSYVTVTLKQEEVIVFNHKPKYEKIELFSYVGGFLGMWLGFSLVTISEVVKHFFVAGKYFKRKNSMKLMKHQTRVSVMYPKDYKF